MSPTCRPGVLWLAKLFISGFATRILKAGGCQLRSTAGKRKTHPGALLQHTKGWGDTVMGQEDQGGLQEVQGGEGQA